MANSLHLTLLTSRRRKCGGNALLANMLGRQPFKVAPLIILVVQPAISELENSIQSSFTNGTSSEMVVLPLQESLARTKKSSGGNASKNTNGKLPLALEPETLSPAQNALIADVSLNINCATEQEEKPQIKLSRVSMRIPAISAPPYAVPDNS
jgi:hypothetical protein